MHLMSHQLSIPALNETHRSWREGWDSITVGWAGAALHREPKEWCANHGNPQTVACQTPQIFWTLLVYFNETVVQVLLPSITEQEPPSSQAPQQQATSSGGIGSWLWGTMAGPAPPTSQPPAPQPPQVQSPTPLNETSAPQQPFQDSRGQEYYAPQDAQQDHGMSHDSGPSSPAYRLHRDLSGAHESSTYDTASSQDVDAAARHVALHQAYANHQAQVGSCALQARPGFSFRMASITKSRATDGPVRTGVSDAAVLYA